MTLDPGKVICRMTHIYNLMCVIGSQFGEYEQTLKTSINTMKLQTVGALMLRPTKNFQGAFYYFSLYSGRRLYCRNCTPLEFMYAKSNMS